MTDTEPQPELEETDNGPKDGDTIHPDQDTTPVYLDPTEESA